MKNYYLQGLYLNGDKYSEKFETHAERMIAVKEIREAYYEFEHSAYNGTARGILNSWPVINIHGLQIITELE